MKNCHELRAAEIGVQRIPGIPVLFRALNGHLFGKFVSYFLWGGLILQFDCVRPEYLIFPFVRYLSDGDWRAGLLSSDEYG
jgi:hypothetical protein